MLALSFLQPSRLWLLVLPVVLLAAYVFSQLRRRGYVVRFTTMELLDSVAPKRPHLVVNAGETSATFLVLQGIGEYDFVPLV